MYAFFLDGLVMGRVQREKGRDSIDQNSSTHIDPFIAANESSSPQPALCARVFLPLSEVLYRTEIVVDSPARFLTVKSACRPQRSADTENQSLRRLLGVRRGF
jgi:hypothetical protein